MSDIIDTIFSGLKTDENKLKSYGFKPEGEYFVCKRPMGDGGFIMQITVAPPREISAEVRDDCGEVYTLHLVDGAAGGFVGGIRAEYERILKEVAENCFTPDAFKADQSKLTAQYARITYGDELEFLWSDLPDCAVLRRKDTRKWYAAVMTISKSKLGLDGGGKIDILDIRVNPEELTKIIDNKSFFAGYHMNKKHWLTIVLDGSVDIGTIYKYIDDSYMLAKK